MQEKMLAFIIGVGSTDRSALWQRLLADVPGVSVVEHAPGCNFWLDMGLDIEIMATSLVVVRLDIAPPLRLSYRLEREDYAPIVIVPPALPPRLDEWPPHLAERARVEGLSPGPETSRDQWRAWLGKYGYDLALWNWRQVFKELELVLRTAPQPALRAGFHCDTIGYLGTNTSEEEREVFDAFRVSYVEFRRGGAENEG